jgi:5-aminolevulinate synthase
MCMLVKRYNAITYLDEVRVVGLYGAHGAGTAEHVCIMDRIDIINGTLAKGFEIMGGYIATRRNICDAICSYAPDFIFTTSLAPTLATGALASDRHLKASPLERVPHQERYYSQTYGYRCSGKLQPHRSCDHWLSNPQQANYGRTIGKL